MKDDLKFDFDADWKKKYKEIRDFEEVSGKSILPTEAA
jgi:hypothetical protein